MEQTALVNNEQAILEQANQFIAVVNKIEIENAAAIRSRQKLEQAVNDLIKNNKDNKEALDIYTHAIEIIRQISDEAVSNAYGFLEQSLNKSLRRMFKNTTRQIQIKEYTRAGQYPQLEIVLHVGNGKTRSLKADSGHGLAQIISVLSILSLIVITGSRRILVMDEVVSGLSVHNREVLTEVLWTFTEIGFQFLINDHGYIPKGSHVYHLEMVGDVSNVKKDYIAKRGVYLQGDSEKEYDYSEQGADTVIREVENADTESNSTAENTIAVEEVNNTATVETNALGSIDSTVISI